MEAVSNFSHLLLPASQDHTDFAHLRAEYLRHYAICRDMMKQTDDPHDRMLLRGMARLWLILAERT